MQISVENGTFYYNEKKPVLNDISFSVSDGDLMAILGPNGAGKTTLLRCLMGFLRWKSGKSILNGQDVREIPEREFWRQIAYVPQARSVTSSFTVEETVLLGRGSRIGIFSQPSDEDIKIAHDVMKQLDIERIKDRVCSELSGGELQMVLIARALASQPKALILDEPESNLDFRNQLMILDVLSELSAKGIICIFNTHYPEHALQRANVALLIEKDGGYIFGKTDKVVTEETIQKVFGVRAAIGEIETEASTVKSVVPIETVSEVKTETCSDENADERVLAVMSIILKKSDAAERLNKILHEKTQYIVGRMGMPYRAADVNIINITLDAPMSEIKSLSAELGVLSGVQVKVSYIHPEWQKQTVSGQGK